MRKKLIIVCLLALLPLSLLAREQEDADTGNGVTNTINVQGGGTLDLRTSTYADFASFPIEKDHVYTIYGVLSRYNDGWQLGMRTMSDIKE